MCDKHDIDMSGFWKNMALLVVSTGLFVFAIVNLTGCNTVAGFGKDLQAAANGIQNEMAGDDDSYDRHNSYSVANGD